MAFFFIHKPLWKYVFYNAILCMFFQMTLNQNSAEKIKTKAKNLVSPKE